MSFKFFFRIISVRNNYNLIALLNFSCGGAVYTETFWPAFPFYYISLKTLAIINIQYIYLLPLAYSGFFYKFFINRYWAYILKIGYDNTSLPVFIALFLFGLAHWTLVEYGIHRFVFHLDDHVPRHTIFYTIHFLMHGVHHLLPMDRLRLVMPPALFCFLATPFALFYFGLFPIGIAATIFGSNVLGYVYYDLCHYAMHHAELPGFLHALKRHHIEHHYKNYQLGFGITNRFWDDVFGTNFGKDAPIAPSKVKSE